MLSKKSLGWAALIAWCAACGDRSAAAPPRPTPPARDPHSPGFVTAVELPDGAVPPANAEGNFILGPTHRPAPEMTVAPGVPRGRVYRLTMKSEDSKIYPGIARDANTFGTPDPADPAKLIVTTSRPARYTREVQVWTAEQLDRTKPAPFIVGADGPDELLFDALRSLVAQGRVPPMAAISIGNGGGDAQGSQRGLEYDTMSGRYAEFVETEVLPVVENQCRVKLTKDPDGRAAMGCSSGAACAMIMAWYRPDLYHRVLSYSGTYVNQQWPSSAETPGGAWELHHSLIPHAPRKPLRVWMHVGDCDLLNPNSMRDGMHDWVVANERMAQTLADKGYRYQFVFARNATHCDGSVKQQTLPAALEWLWHDYPAKKESGVAEAEKRAPVEFSGGHEIGRDDFGRPVTLMAAALGVKPEQFREAFSGVTPARGRGPTGGEARANKAALMRVLAPLGVTNERMDEVADYYRFRPQAGELWPTREAKAHAIISDGRIVRVVVDDPGSGYSSPPEVTVKGFEGTRFAVTLGYSKNLKKNGTVAKVEGAKKSYLGSAKRPPADSKEN
jgi:enterochelin esterase-like enzyme